MIVKLIYIGKTGKSFLIEGEKEYTKRLKRYIKFDSIELPDIKNAKKMSFEEVKNKEGSQILSKIKDDDRVFLLDEKGKEFDSVGLSKFIQKQFNLGGQAIVFVIGGPYGFSDEVYQRATGKIALGRLTFSHQMIRMFFIEQLYRSMTIIKGEPYHHQ